ncbi:three component ABC system middle component [Bradyrhizobium sp. RT3b]|uniref:three component ABC system middle component n=1 Tax=Bradyrhizobium sp. RT3b TaxID=3156334 RepID=UPI0033951E21
MRPDHEEVLLRNPALGACIFWHLSRSFSEFGRGRAPELPYFLVGAGMIFHQVTIDKIRRMQFESGLLKAISDRPDIIAGLQGRMEEHSLGALRALQVGAASGLIQREGGDGFPTFRAEGSDLPRALRDATAGVTDMLNGAKRLGAWFASEGMDVLFKQLNLEL